MSSSVQIPVAKQLAQWALSLRLGDVPPNVIERVKLHVLDQVGAQLSCRNLPTPRLVRDYVAKFGVSGQSAVLGTTLRLDAEYAAFSNATTGSSFEIDDYGGNGAYAHPGCVVVPGALAMGEEAGASGAEVLLAATVGFETVIRLALATMPSLLLERGFHQTGSHGVFAVALAGSVLGRHDVDTAVNALSIAGSHASGTAEYAQTGGEVKRAHSGIGVSGGIRSTRLAAMGLTAPPTIFEGKRGFLQAFCNGYDAGPLHTDLGSRWHFAERGSIKPFASCGLVHHHFAAYDKIKEKVRFAAEDIREIVLGCEPLIIVHNGAAGPHPKDLVGAQFSAEYGMAMRVVKGRNDVGAYLDAESDGFNDPAVAAVAERVRLEADPLCASGPPMGRVTIRLENGQTLTETGYALGSPLNPLSRADIEGKYFDLVSRDFGDAVARDSMQMIMHLEDLKDLGDLTRMFAR